MNDAWIIDACRTPRGIGKLERGALADVHAQQVGATVLCAIADRNAIDTAEVDDVIWGTCAQMGPQRHLGRMAALDAGFDFRSSGVTLDRFCGSGLTAVNFAAATIQSGMSDLVVAGGTELMSGKNFPPHTLPPFDAGNLRLRARHPQTHQGVCADAIASIEGISRDDLDRYAVESQRRAAVAIADGRFKGSVVPVFHENGELALDYEQHPRPETTLEDLTGLKPSFERLADHPVDGTGVTFRELLRAKYPDVNLEFMHHAGNSSGVVDGAAAILLASPDYARSHGLKPRARVVAMANQGDCPTLMLNAPVPAIQKILRKAGLELQDIDLFEINEAFAVVVEKVIRDLGLDRNKVNVNGGAIALGHPIGATGAILIGTMVDELERRGAKRALITMCAGGGQAPAIIIERMD